MLELRDLVGEFEKPRSSTTSPSCARTAATSRSAARACIDVCSARAIRSDASLKGKAGQAAAQPGAPVPAGRAAASSSSPHLCVGCGACTTVCPSGALSFAYPGTVDQGRRLRTLLTAYASAGGRDAALLLHSEGAGSA